MIISVGYRVKSQRGITFRKWATAILKEYMVQGYAVNEKRLKVLNKAIEIQSNIIADVLELDSKEVLDVIQKYSQALELLDDYDHQIVKKPVLSNKEAYKLNYKECRNLIDSMTFSDTSTIFGKEKSKGALEGVIGSIYQTAFGEDSPSLPLQATNTIESKSTSVSIIESHFLMSISSLICINLNNFSTVPTMINVILGV